MKGTMLFAGIVLLLFAGACAAEYAPVQITANPDSVYGVSSVQLTPNRIYPGDQASISFTIAPVSGYYTHAAVTTSAPFTGSNSQIKFDQLSSTAPQQVSVSIDVSNETKAGTYPLYVSVVDDKNAAQIVATIGLVVNEPAQTSLLTASISSGQQVIPGGTVPVSIKVSNNGDMDAQDVVVSIADSTGTFTPLGSDRKYIGLVKTGEEATAAFTVGVEAGATPGYFPLAIDINYNKDNIAQPAIEQNLGLTIESKPSLVISSDQSTSADGTTTLTVTVANAGDTSIRGLYASIESRGYRVVGQSTKFIGVLNLDDSSTATFSLSPLQALNGQNASARTRPQQAANGTVPTDAALADQANGQAVNLILTFKDPLNQDHTITKAVQIGASSAAGASSANFTRQSRGIQFLGIDWTVWAGAIVVLVAGFFGYRRYKAQKEAHKK